MRGPVVRFLEEAFDVLRQTHAGRGANLHVIQCDDMVRSDDVVTCEGDLRRLVNGFELRGGGAPTSGPCSTTSTGWSKRAYSGTSGA